MYFNTKRCQLHPRSSSGRVMKRQWTKTSRLQCSLTITTLADTHSALHSVCLHPPFHCSRRLLQAADSSDRDREWRNKCTQNNLLRSRADAGRRQERRLGVNRNKCKINSQVVKQGCCKAVATEIGNGEGLIALTFEVIPSSGIGTLYSI